MIVNIEHTKMPDIKFKKHEYADIVETISETGYQIINGMGYDLTFAPLTLIYAISVISKTSSAVLKKMEEQEENENNNKGQY